MKQKFILWGFSISVLTEGDIDKLRTLLDSLISSYDITKVKFPNKFGRVVSGEIPLINFLFHTKLDVGVPLFYNHPLIAGLKAHYKQNVTSFILIRTDAARVANITFNFPHSLLDKLGELFPNEYIFTSNLIDLLSTETETKNKQSSLKYNTWATANRLLEEGFQFNEVLRFLNSSYCNPMNLNPADCLSPTSYSLKDILSF